MTRTMHEDDAQHPIVAQLRALRKAAGLSLAGAETRYGISAVVIGSYERGDRQPGLNQLARVLAFYGYELRAVPAGSTVVVDPTQVGEDLILTDEHAVAMLRLIAAQIESTLPQAQAVADDVLARIGAQRDGSE